MVTGVHPLTGDKDRAAPERSKARAAVSTITAPCEAERRPELVRDETYAEKTGHLRYQSVVKDLAGAVAGGAPLGGLPRLLWPTPPADLTRKAE
jgi:hypothetical protein